jgi:hypothetical protein
MTSFYKKHNQAQLRIATLGMILATILAACSGGGGQAEIIANVNGEPITREMFNAEWLIPKVISEELGQVPLIIPKDELLNEMVNSILMAQSAQEAGFTVSDQEVQQDLALFLANLGTTQEEFETRLVENRITWSMLEKIVRRNLIVNKYQNDYVLSRVAESERQDVLNSWLNVLKEQSTIEFEPDFLDEIGNE